MFRKSGIFLLVLYSCTALLPLSSRLELRKLPGLVEHYFEHQADVSPISFFDFLQLHYGKDYQQHESAHNHSKLPGKEAPDPAQMISCSVAFAGLPAALFLNLRIPGDIRHALIPSDEQLLSSNISSGIWQPPRLV